MTNVPNSSPNFKDIAKSRLAKSSLMKIPWHDRNIIENENIKPIPNKTVEKQKHLNVHIRKSKDEKIHNPYDIPNHMRVFIHRSYQKKEKPIPFIMTEPLTICDIDDTFYKVIEGRPLRQLDDIKVYMRNIRNITLSRSNASYLKDQIIQVDTNIVDELSHYKKVYDFYSDCKIIFFQFANQRYDITKQIQNMADRIASELAGMIENLESYSFLYVKLKNEIFSLVVVLETFSRYRTFLIGISPDTWQKMYNKPEQKVEFKDKVTSSTTTLDNYKKVVEVHFPAVLYFKTPRQLIQIFENTSKQCLNYMQIKVFTDDVLRFVLKGRDNLKLAIEKQISEMEDFIHIYEDYIKYMESKEIEYKRIFLELIENDFQKLYASYGNVKLFTCIQFAHSRIFEEKEDPKDSAFTLMQNLESLYLELTSALDILNQDVVKRAEKEMFSEDIKIISKAVKAQRALKESDILEKALYTSFQPPRTKFYRKEN